jgi:flagellar protein FliJ
MNRALETLVRVHQSRIDEVQHALGIVTAEQNKLALDRASFERMVRDERTFASEHHEFATYYASFVPHAASMQNAFSAQEDVLAEREKRLRDDLADAFLELKKVETLLASEAERERRSEQAIERAAFDETAILQAARRDRAS